MDEKSQAELSEIQVDQHLRSMFLSNVTHEFRTPLSSLCAAVEFLLDEYDQLSRSEIKELLTSIRLSVTGLNTLIDNLLESTLIEAGSFSIRPQPMEIGEVINETVLIMKPLLNRRQQTLRVKLSPQLPLVRGDPNRLTQVLVNLISNASKYGPMGEDIDIEVEVRDADMVRVTVADRGLGIPNPQRSRLFSPFSAHDSAKNPKDGIGIGLSVVKAIVEKHGGQVGAEDRMGGGLQVWFTLPRVGYRR